MLHEREDYADLIVQVAQQNEIGASLVEKDYWVTETLRVIASEFGVGVVFKGGTSLSKAHGLINRFSEDIDLLIVPDAAELITPGDRDRYMKRIAERVGQIDGLTLRPEPDHSSRGKSRTVTYDYQPVAEGMLGVVPTLILEMGIRGGPQPQREMPLASMLGEGLSAAGVSDVGTQAFPMTVLDPSRTFVEKLSAIHSGCTRFQEGDHRALRRISRHYTDIDALLGLEEIRNFISQPNYEMLIEEVQLLSAENFPASHRELSSSRFAGSIALSPPPALLEALRADHESSAPIYFRGAPNLDEVIARIADSRDAL